MKTLTVGMQAHVAGSVVTLAKCLHITRRTDQAEFFLTEHDADLVIDGDTYIGTPGISVSAIKNSSDLSVEQLEVSGILSDSVISAADIRAGMFDLADAEVFAVNFRDLSQGRIKLRTGLVGNTRISGEAFVLEIKGLTQFLQAIQGGLCSPTCRDDLFGVFCALNFMDFEETTTVATVTDRRIFTATALTPGPPTDDYYVAGLVTFDTGANLGISREIKAWTLGSSTIELHLATPYDIAPGDSIRVLPGCRKRFQEDCITKFANGINFVGEPLLPGRDRLLDVPDNST